MIHWICTGPVPRHAGTDEKIPHQCPYCDAPCVERTHCACGHAIADCNQSICSHPFAKDD